MDLILQFRIPSAFSKVPAPAGAPVGTLLQIASCIPAFSTREKGVLGPFYQLRWVLAKGRHLLQILLKALHTPSQLLQGCEP